jgi:hypothetical protein
VVQPLDGISDEGTATNASQIPDSLIKVVATGKLAHSFHMSGSLERDSVSCEDRLKLGGFTDEARHNRVSDTGEI